VAGQFKTIRSYYSEFVVNKALQTGAVKASHDHKGQAGTIPIPATMMLDISSLMANSDTSLSFYRNIRFPPQGP